MKFLEKEKAIKLRELGYSLNEISRTLNVAKSSASLWARDVYLSKSAKERLLTIIKKGQYIAAEKKKLRSQEINTSLQEEARKQVKERLDTRFEKLLCAMLYWCEGVKDYRSGVSFMNSDPHLAKLFVELLIKTFNARRDKFVVVLHLHEYHDPQKQRRYWAKFLGFSSKQFRKNYLKPNTEKRIRTNYPGCASIRYYDSILSRKVLYMAQAYLNKI